MSRDWGVMRGMVQVLGCWWCASRAMEAFQVLKACLKAPRPAGAGGPSADQGVTPAAGEECIFS